MDGFFNITNWLNYLRAIFDHVLYILDASPDVFLAGLILIRIYKTGLQDSLKIILTQAGDSLSFIVYPSSEQLWFPSPREAGLDLCNKW